LVLCNMGGGASKKTSFEAPGDRTEERSTECGEAQVLVVVPALASGDSMEANALNNPDGNGKPPPVEAAAAPPQAPAADGASSKRLPVNGGAAAAAKKKAAVAAAARAAPPSVYASLPDDATGEDVVWLMRKELAHPWLVAAPPDEKAHANDDDSGPSTSISKVRGRGPRFLRKLFWARTVKIPLMYVYKKK
jgi:hypothetical protein